MNGPEPETSVVIRTYNEEHFLPALLESIATQEYRDFEVVVVDSGSFDRTLHAARSSGVKIVQIDSHDFTFGFSLNAGIQVARGRFVVIVSAHTKSTDERWLGSLVQPLRSDGVAMVYGRQLGAAESNLSEALDFQRTFGAEKRELEPPDFLANNANSAVRRDLWVQSPFDETLPGLEDVAWAKHWMERGYRVIYEPAAAVYHYHDETWSQVHQRYCREALAARWIGIKAPSRIPWELARELRYLAKDLLHAARSRRLREKAHEILGFRAQKSFGTISGLVRRQGLEDPEQRRALFFDRTCKAWVVHGPNHASLEQMEVPQVKPGDVLIEVAYEGICGTDLEIYSGQLGYYKNGVANYPIIPGHEFSGWIADVGANVNDARVGDRVVVECIQSCGSCPECKRANWIGCQDRVEMGVIAKNGGYSQYVAAPARFVHSIPPKLDMRRAALCEPTAIVLKGLQRVDWLFGSPAIQAGTAVVGAGPIGQLCARILTLRGFPVSVFDREPRRLSYLDDIDAETSDNLDGIERFALIVEATGDPDALHLLLEKSKPGATLLLLGLPYSRREFSFESVVAYDKAVVGSVGSGASDFREALQILPRLCLDSFLEHTIRLEDVLESWQRFEERRHLKTLVEVQRDSSLRSATRSRSSQPS